MVILQRHKKWHRASFFTFYLKFSLLNKTVPPSCSSSLGVVRAHVVVKKNAQINGFLIKIWLKKSYIFIKNASILIIHSQQIESSQASTF